MFKIIFPGKNAALFAALFAVIILCSSCAGTQTKNNSEREATEAAYDALAELDGRPRSNPQATAPQGAAPAGGAAPAPQEPARPKPAWVDSPDTVYNKQRYVSAVGYGSDRNLAERDALAKLTGVFGQSVQSELITISNYSEAVKNKSIQVNENSSVQNAITTSAEMDSLVGAEIADVWYDNRSLYYAAAIMEKDKTAILYADLIRSNERIINDLTSLRENEKNTLDAYSRFLLAGTIADANRIYANVLTVVGDTRGIVPSQMKNGNDYRIEAASMVKNIPIGIAVSGDRGERIKNAFSKALGGIGFRSGSNNSRYMLNASYTLEEVILPGQQNKFVRYHVIGRLEDNDDGNNVLLSYDTSGREGHLTIPEAEERATRSAENKIPGEFETALRSYLSSLVSGKK